MPTAAIDLWTLLRQQSSVDLKSVLLTGAGAARHVKIDVAIDGVASAALGVMSQGELHAMALSLFLPRATLPESPFRFVVIDDPVQSMDPARVDGLARVLEDVARKRQVIVFTHDDRLAESIRRLGIDARVIAVMRRENSVVDVTTTVDPTERNLDDADAVAADEHVPPDLARQVVPGYCRAAIEAAAIEIVRRRRIERGESHDAVEKLLETNDAAQTAPRPGALRQRRQGWGSGRQGLGLGNLGFRGARLANQGAHGAGSLMALRELVTNTRKFCTRLREVAR